jgi:hypothetical protein
MPLKATGPVSAPWKAILTIFASCAKAAPPNVSKTTVLQRAAVADLRVKDFDAMPMSPLLLFVGLSSGLD